MRTGEASLKRKHYLVKGSWEHLQQSLQGHFLKNESILGKKYGKYRIDQEKYIGSVGEYSIEYRVRPPFTQGMYVVAYVELVEEMEKECVVKLSIGMDVIWNTILTIMSVVLPVASIVMYFKGYGPMVTINEVVQPNQPYLIFPFVLVILAVFWGLRFVLVGVYQGHLLEIFKSEFREQEVDYVNDKK